MKRLQLPESKEFRFYINVLLIAAWISFYHFVGMYIWYWLYWHLFNSFGATVLDTPSNFINRFLYIIPILFITRYIWFEKSRKRIFFGLFNKFPNLEPRIYTTTSNADELKKYADLKDQGIITEEEFQAKKKKLLDL